MNNLNKTKVSFKEVILIFLSVELVWYVGRLVNPNESAEGLRLYTALVAIFIYLPLRVLILIFFPRKEENNEDTDE